MSEEFADVYDCEEAIISSPKPKKEINRWYKKECFACGAISTYRAKARPEFCPTCGAEFWDKPADEYKLFVLQKKYFESGRDKAVLSLMFLAIKEYAENLIKRRAKNKKFFVKSYLNEKSSEAATLLVEQYLKNPSYQINISFGGCLKRVLDGVMYKDQRSDRFVSLNHPVNNSSGEFQDILYRFGYQGDDPSLKKIESKDSHLCNDEFFDIIEKISSSIKNAQSTESSLGYLLLLSHRLSKRRLGFINAFYRSFGYEHRDNFEKAEIVLRRYIKEVL